MYEIKYRDENRLKGDVSLNIKYPSDWNLLNLRHTINILTDFTANGSFADLAKNVKYLDEVDYARLVRLVDLRKDLNENETGVYISKKSYKYLSKSKLYGHEILLANVGANAGFICKMPVVDYPCSLAPNMMMMKFDKRLESNYFYYLGNSEYAKKQLQIRANSSSAQPKLNKEDIRCLRVVIPNIDEQQKIANFLDIKTAQFDNIIAKKEQLIKELELAKKSLISEVVTGKVKIVDGQLVTRDAAEMKDSGVAWLGMIPHDWITEKMKYIGNSIIGLTYSPDDVVDENGTLVLRSSNVQSGNITFDNNVYVNKKINPKLAVKEGDILICSRNGSRNLIGKNALIMKEHEGATFGAFMTIFRTKYSRFIHLVLNSTLFDYQAGSYLTSTVNQLTISNLNNMVVPFPTLKDQNTIYEYLSNKLSVFTKSVDLNLKQIEKLNQAKQSLISEAVTGKIDLRDWEIIEEGDVQ